MRISPTKALIVVIAGPALLAGIVLTSCIKAAPNGETASAPRSYDAELIAKNRLTYQPGDEIPHEFVCMKTDQYREMRQLLVEFEGKAYYGCCEKCNELIPANPRLRTAADPLTGEPVDKATAYIILTGNNEQVMYFANEENYRLFLRDSR